MPSRANSNSNSHANGNGTSARQRVVATDSSSLSSPSSASSSSHSTSTPSSSSSNRTSSPSPTADAVREAVYAKRAAKKIAPVSPILDAILTIVYLVSTLIMVVIFIREGSSAIGIFLGLLLCVHIITNIVRNLAERAGKAISGSILKKQPFCDPLRKKQVLSKWSDTAWQFTIHVSMSIAEAHILSNEPWWSDTRTLWTPHPRDQVHSFGLSTLYKAQLAVWIYTCFSHRFIESRRKDYVVMFIHHIVTIILVGGSYSQGYLRIGLLVLFVHDATDIVVDLVKLANYCKLENKEGFFISELIFTINLVSWSYYRLYLFPTHVIYSSLIEGHQMCSAHDGLDLSFWNNWTPYPLYMLCNALLILLLCLHWFWFFLFVRILYKVITKGAHEAGAEEYEGESGSGSDLDQ